MALVRISRGQVRLPAETRKALQIWEGDWFEAEVVGNSVILKPVDVRDRDTALQKLMEIVNRPKWSGSGPEPSEDEVMEMVVEEIHAMRRNDEKGRS